MTNLSGHSSASDLLEEARREIVRFTPVEALAEQRAGALLVDIRSDSARERDGIVPGSVHMPRTVLEWRLDATSPWRNPHVTPYEAPLILLCDHGWSSSLAASALQRLGHEWIGDVIGGFEAWQASGLLVRSIAVERPRTGELPGMRPPDGHHGSGAPSVEQLGRWEDAFRERPDRYGSGPSEPAQAALDRLRRARARDLLELGGGQGRDSIFFARAGLSVTVVDFAETAVSTIAQKTVAEGVANRVCPVEHDVRDPLPFAAASFDACYSHMLLCMSLNEPELHALTAELRRVLRPGGLCIYTARTTGDPDFGRGTPLGGRLYELDGFAVHFFDRALVNGLATGLDGTGFELLEVEEFEEGVLPRRLVRVTMRKVGL